MYLLLLIRHRHHELMKASRTITEKTASLALKLRDSLRDPVGERLERERRRDRTMFSRHGAFLPWAP
jgi:hypothetical protein